MLMKSAPDFVIAMRDHDRAQHQTHHKLRQRLQAIEKIEIHASPRDLE